MELHIAHATIHITAPLGVPGELLSTLEPAAPLQAEFKSCRPHVTPKPGDAWPGAGGIYVGFVPAMLGTPARHLIASAEETRLRFGPTSDIMGARSHVDGPANTLALLVGDHPAARWCADYSAEGHSDFHLPSRMDLLMAYLQSPDTFNKEGWYWSSTQDSSGYAFVQGFADGSSDWNGKGSEFRVRAFRQILLNA